MDDETRTDRRAQAAELLTMRLRQTPDLLDLLAADLSSLHPGDDPDPPLDPVAADLLERLFGFVQLAAELVVDLNAATWALATGENDPARHPADFFAAWLVERADLDS